MKPLLRLLSGLLLLGACEKKQDQDFCGPEQFTPVSAQAVPFMAGQNVGGQGTRTLVINSAADLATVPLPQVQLLPPIDFTQYTLIGGLSSRSGGVGINGQSVTQDCDGNYHYSVVVRDGVIAMPSSCFYGLLVPKLAANAQVFFDVQEN